MQYAMLETPTNPTAEYYKKSQDFIDHLEQTIAEKDAEIEKLRGMLAVGLGLDYGVPGFSCNTTQLRSELP